jgi:hypothetical protein
MFDKIFMIVLVSVLQPMEDSLNNLWKENSKIIKIV